MRSLKFEQQGAIARVTVGRGDGLNAIDAETVRELASICEAVRGDDDARVVLLTGAGDVFSHGWDLESVCDSSESSLAVDPFGCLSALPKPVVCALNGDALGAGLELALACDVRVAAQGAQFGLPYVSLGLVPFGGGTQRLPRLIGKARALEMILTGEPVEAREALRIGLVSAVVPRDQLISEAERIANRIAERGPLAVQYAKEAVSRGTEMPLDQALRYETDLTVILQTTEDRAEGVRAFLEKREPKFNGR